MSHLDSRAIFPTIRSWQRRTQAHSELPTDPDYREAIWDPAAGALLVEEAGGRVTDLDGLPLDFTTGRRLLRNTGLLASNGLVHDAVLNIVRQRRPAALRILVAPSIVHGEDLGERWAFEAIRLEVELGKFRGEALRISQRAAMAIQAVSPLIVQFLDNASNVTRNACCVAR